MHRARRAPRPESVPAREQDGGRSHRSRLLAASAAAVLVAGAVLASLGLMLVRASEPARQEAPPGEPPLDRSGRIAFTGLRGETREVYAANADGTDEVNVSDHPANDYAPDWSPDGTRLAFVSDRDGDPEVFVSAADGSGLRQITDNLKAEGEPEWSPDGSRIAFQSHRDGDGEIYAMDAGGDALGANVTRLTDNAADDGSPAWSADGRIYFASNRDGAASDASAVGGTTAGAFEIYAMDATGEAEGRANATRLTDNEADDLRPAVSPDGRRLAFMSDRDGPAGAFGIYAMDVGGANATRLTREGEALDANPAWLPDGSGVVYQSAGATPDFELYAVADEPASSPSRLTSNGTTEGEPDWRPEGPGSAAR